jgi:hypothetical protein
MTTAHWTSDDDGERLVWDPLIELDEGVWHELESCCGPGLSKAGQAAAAEAWAALVGDVRAARRADVATAVMEGWWHPNVKSGQVHDHPEAPGRGWSHASHRLCEPVYTHRAVAHATGGDQP